MKHGDNLSPTLFVLFINDLVNKLNSLRYGIQVGTYKINALLYDDDIVILTENETILQKLLDKLYAWCTKWKLEINQSKSKIIHFRKNRKAQSQVIIWQEM